MKEQITLSVDKETWRAYQKHCLSFEGKDRFPSNRIEAYMKQEIASQTLRAE